jgi:hypothetical protein
MFINGVCTKNRTFNVKFSLTLNNLSGYWINLKHQIIFLLFYLKFHLQL